MLNSETLEIVIGLAFTYFILSLLCTTITELIARAFALRAVNLEDALRNLLAEPQDHKSIIHQIRDLFKPIGGRTASSPSSYFYKLYSHPIIKNLSQEASGHALGGRGGKPSYISSHDFCIALLDILVPSTAGGSKTMRQVRVEVDKIQVEPLKKALLAVLDEAQYDIDKGRASIERWFNDYMDRVEGWYRRKAQLIALVVSVLVVGILNADTLAIATTLSTNAAVRASVVTAADAIVKQYSQQAGSGELSPAVAADKIQTLTSTLQKPGIPLGWQGPQFPSSKYAQTKKDVAPKSKPDGREPSDWDDICWLVSKIFGLVITALLVSLGAPFWFDLLSKLTNLRATGKVPETSVPAGQNQTSKTD